MTRYVVANDSKVVYIVAASAVMHRVYAASLEEAMQWASLFRRQGMDATIYPFYDTVVESVLLPLEAASTKSDNSS